MTEKQLWEYFLSKRVFTTRPFDRDFVWIKKEDFQPMRKFFVKDFNLVHHGESFRSLGYLQHSHAVDQGDYVFIHPDMGNLARFFPLGVIHLFLDVIPYLVYAAYKRKSLESIFARPNEQM